MEERPNQHVDELLPGTPMGSDSSSGGSLATSMTGSTAMLLAARPSSVISIRAQITTPSNVKIDERSSISRTQSDERPPSSRSRRNINSDDKPSSRHLRNINTDDSLSYSADDIKSYDRPSSPHSPDCVRSVQNILKLNDLSGEEETHIELDVRSSSAAENEKAEEQV